MAKKICSREDCQLAGIPQNTDSFYIKDKKTGKLASACKTCTCKDVISFYEDNKDEILQDRKQYYQDNRPEVLERTAKYRENNRDEINAKAKVYRQNNPKQVAASQKNTRRKRMKSDPAYKMRMYMSGIIGAALKRNGSSKNGLSCLKYLGYSMDELKKYIEDQFESWMNWENRGKYNPAKWDDNDLTTWRWQLDHITPQSDFPYYSMMDDNFKKCWALENLRPLSAKQNLLDGCKRTRHGKNKDSE